MRSTPHLPLDTPKTDSEKIINKVKSSQEDFFVVASSTSSHFHDSTFKTLEVVSNSPFLPTVEVSRHLDFENFPVEYSSFSPKLKEEIFETLTSREVVGWFRLESLEDFPTLGLPNPPPNKVVVTKEEETHFPFNPIPSSSKIQPLPLKTETSLFKLPFSPKTQAIVLPVKTPSSPCSPIVHNQMAGANPPRNRMDSIVAARYSPLVLPQPMNALPVGDYLKYMPKFTAEEDIIA
jgi:hypothetical protein